MTRSRDRFVAGIAVFFVLLGVCTLPATAQRHEYEGYYLRSSETYPKLWSPIPYLDRELQGVAHDAQNWYFTWTNNDPNIGYLWKVPVDVPLDDNCILGGGFCPPPNPRVVVIDMTQFPYLNGGLVGTPLPPGTPSQVGYWHWGDPDYYRDLNTATDYIVVPMTASPYCSNDPTRSCKRDFDCDPSCTAGHTCISQKPMVGIFRGSDLTLAAYGKLNAQVSIGWCAIQPGTRELYTSDDFDYKGAKCVGGTNDGAPCKFARYCPFHDSCCPCAGDVCTPIDDCDKCECPGGNCVSDGDCDNQANHYWFSRTLSRYSVPWERIPSSGCQEIPLTRFLDDPPIELRGPHGEPLELYNMQGGQFTSGSNPPSAELLYITAGSGCCLGHGAGQQYALDGLYVFDTHTWKELQRSRNHHCVGSNERALPANLGQMAAAFLSCNSTSSLCPQDLPTHFDYYYCLGCDGSSSWTPEGLTIWDLDDGTAPGIRGQLHVFAVRVARYFADNEAAFEHYGSRLYVDADKGVDREPPVNVTDSPLPGGVLAPFKTLGCAYSVYPAWDGVEIVLQAGSYPETGRLSTRVRLKSRGGAAVIGRGGHAMTCSP